ncbi:peptidoglycan/xylan/chitin deacetylase (PgdA/CDA1 family) [Scopulibacillus darangshiensis]|uniref:Peptidoglycan/xylan/chitin deacetylase (PgdA/CDA1 family) n=1 Tax=Scopulibacillus darangshiensis TaxID=442528 RepID=A0A4R2NFB7_9BACL|nr:polysaccharide deacetylase family protein [Scopulibacillus darangshiensis]TCP19981.1 peptidoglycan/xylan/chitin deacetylase (PgdA/CDA1 family) [Scopulibacillus darangshiensis]
MRVLWLLLLILTVLLLFICYSILPTVIMRAFALGVFQRSKVPNKAALTFDDGPDPVYTPKLLDLCLEYKVKATFFVVGEHAAKHPEIIKRMQKEGHTIGIHHYRHLSNWFLSPWAVRRQCRQTADVIESITGIRPQYYRPPWGHLNLSVKWASAPFKIIMWSAILGDWRLGLGREKLKKRLLDNVNGGAVIVLHDCGVNPGADEEAPAMMLRALEEFLDEIGGQYNFVTIDALAG